MRYIRINPLDNVAVALSPLKAGERVCEGASSSGEGGFCLMLRDDIPAGHKFTLRDLSAGENVVKYGFPIGHLTCDAPQGSCIDHNCIKTNLEGLLEYEYSPIDTPCRGKTSPDTIPTFRGYRRADSRVGIRNQIWIIPTVGCVNGITQSLATRFSAEIGENSPVDAVVAFPHNYGCSQLGADHQNTRTVLADMVHHPNAGGILIVSLGCENNQLDSFMELVGPFDASRVKTMTVQRVDGDELEYGLQLLRDIYSVCCKDVREEVPVSELKIGLKCGGSDGLSGITANPMLGRFSDWLIARGGTTVLTEVPEMFGAETLLMNRCADRALFEDTVRLINDFKNYFIASGQPVYENPSPGNKAGGISTLEEKSLGCTQKSGSSPVRGVLQYGQRIEKSGLNLLSAPGNDLVASTALAASGCQMVLFTTGRGTPFGTFVPTAKISTNTPLFTKKPGWIDFNAGVIADAEDCGLTADVDSKFVDFVLGVAGGVPVNNEKNGWREIAIFKSGVTL